MPVLTPESLMRGDLGAERLRQGVINPDAEFQRFLKPGLGEHPRRPGPREFGARFPAAVAVSNRGAS